MIYFEIMDKNDWEEDKKENPTRRCEFSLSPVPVKIIKVSRDEYEKSRQKKGNELYPKVWCSRCSVVVFVLAQPVHTRPRYHARNIGRAFLDLAGELSPQSKCAPLVVATVI